MTQCEISDPAREIAVRGVSRREMIWCLGIMDISSERGEVGIVTEKLGYGLGGRSSSKRSVHNQHNAVAL